MVLPLHERLRDDGSLARTWLTAEAGRVRVHGDDLAGELAPSVLIGVMERYGRPLELGGTYGE